MSKPGNGKKENDTLNTLLSPESVAIVGASSTENKVGHTILQNIINNGFEGKIYPINPNATNILDLPTYDTVEDIPDPVDTIIFAVPGAIIRDILPACASKGAENVIIVSAGFDESTSDIGSDLQSDIKKICEKNNLTVVGPNTTGMVTMKNKLVASIEPFPDWEDGTVAIGAQSGIFAGVYMQELMHTDTQAIGYNYAIGMGNKIGLDETKFIKHAHRDNDVDVIQLHLESIRKPKAFFSAAAEISQDKPIILLKTGRTPEGRSAARWHTASTPTHDESVDAACQSSGIIRADDLPQFTDYARGFDSQPTPNGRNVGVITTSGGNGVIAADAISNSALELASPTKDTLEQIKSIAPDWQPIRNPVDIFTAISESGARQGHEQPLRLLLDDKNVDAVLTIHLASDAPDFDDLDEMYRSAQNDHPEKPILSYIMGGQIKERWLQEMTNTDVPVYDSATAAIDTLESMYRYQKYVDGRETYDPNVESTRYIV
jgi:acyl-CoA synthetase (NDP forming)